jgi:hypothetical protein
MNKSKEYERVREDVSKEIRDASGFLESLEWNDLDEQDKDIFRGEADKILSIKGIGILRDDQTLPENRQPEAYWVTHPHFETGHDAVMELI